MAKKERIVPEYELGRPLMAPDPVLQWWEPTTEEERMDQTTHGASGVGTRAARHAKQPRKRPERASRGWIIGLVVLVLVVGLATVVFFDMRRGLSPAAPEATVGVVKAGPRVDPKLISPDTVKDKLITAGYEVGHLEQSYDRTQHGYDVAETTINGKKAEILALPDPKTARAFVGAARLGQHVVVWKGLWAISFGRTQDFPTKQLAEEIAGKLNAQFAWEPQGE